VTVSEYARKIGMVLLSGYNDVLGAVPCFEDTPLNASDCTKVSRRYLPYQVPPPVFDETKKWNTWR
jgi:hypothetical protein